MVLGTCGEQGGVRERQRVGGFYTRMQCGVLGVDAYVRCLECHKILIFPEPNRDVRAKPTPDIIYTPD